MKTVKEAYDFLFTNHFKILPQDESIVIEHDVKPIPEWINDTIRENRQAFIEHWYNEACREAKRLAYEIDELGNGDQLYRYIELMDYIGNIEKLLPFSVLKQKYPDLNFVEPKEKATKK